MRLHIAFCMTLLKDKSMVTPKERKETFSKVKVILTASTKLTIKYLVSGEYLGESFDLAKLYSFCQKSRWVVREKTRGN